MIAPLGRSLILLSLLCATAGALVAFSSGARRSAAGWAWARRFAYGYAACAIGANLLMIYALLARDFSVSYVAQVGSLAVPNWVAVVSLWSSLEGSILFWGLVLGLYVFGATYTNRDRHAEYMPWATGVWLACAAFFAFLIAGPAQPFLTVPNPPGDGPGPNPLLQNHLLMVIHPPFLYAGFVGMTIPFGLAAAALLTGRLGHDFLRPLRTWLMIPWAFLTVAIVLGGWWAYEVLGWGGYWAWDPVENASFLPWLTATAAFHSALLMERKGVLKGWTVTLILATFLLTILGTFMTRSGVFNSVHSFTQSAIGPTILVFLVAATLFTLALLATRIDRLSPEGTLEPGASRDTSFLLNNLLLVLLTFTVLVGTVFPLVVEAVRGVQMSVGRPYFDRMAVPIGIALLFLIGVGPALPWGRVSREQLKAALLPPLAGALGFAVLGLATGVRHPWTLLALACGGYAAQVTLGELWLPVGRRLQRGEGLLAAVREVQSRGRRRVAGYVVHAGMVLALVAVAVSSTEGVTTEVQLARGESVTLGPYTLTFQGVDRVSEPHREALVANVGVKRDGAEAGVLRPRMNYYSSQREPVGTPAVRSTAAHDLYLSVLNLDPDGRQAGLHAMINPMIVWIWVATGIMGLGGLFALLPSRRASAALAAPAPAVAPAAAPAATR
ncbi:MAG: heme lyase CcmF/NrfE family subunit [Vicinamibacteria bacterium]